MPSNVIDMFGPRRTKDSERTCPHCRSVHNDAADGGLLAAACRNAANAARVAAERARDNKRTLRSYRIKPKGDK